MILLVALPLLVLDEVGEADGVGGALAVLLAVAEADRLGSGNGSGVGAADAEGPRPSGMTPAAASTAQGNFAVACSMAGSERTPIFPEHV